MTSIKKDDEIFAPSIFRDGTEKDMELTPSERRFAEAYQSLLHSGEDENVPKAKEPLVPDVVRNVITYLRKIRHEEWVQVDLSEEQINNVVEFFMECYDRKPVVSKDESFGGITVYEMHRINVSTTAIKEDLHHHFWSMKGAYETLVTLTCSPETGKQESETIEPFRFPGNERYRLDINHCHRHDYFLQHFWNPYLPVKFYRNKFWDIDPSLMATEDDPLLNMRIISECEYKAMYKAAKEYEALDEFDCERGIDSDAGRMEEIAGKIQKEIDSKFDKP